MQKADAAAKGGKEFKKKRDNLLIFSKIKTGRAGFRDNFFPYII